MYKQGADACRSKVEEFAASLGLPVVGGSDTHQCLQYGSVINRLKQTCETAAELKEAVAAGAYTMEISPCLDTKVKSSVMMKKLLKQMLGEPLSREELTG
jgi:flagellar biosynthesis/type III secretory pathway ATPase